MIILNYFSTKGGCFEHTGKYFSSCFILRDCMSLLDLHCLLFINLCCYCHMVFASILPILRLVPRGQLCLNFIHGKRGADVKEIQVNLTATTCLKLHRVLANTTASWNSKQTQGMLNGSCVTNVCLSKSHAAPTWMFWARAVAWSTIDSSYRLWSVEAQKEVARDEKYRSARARRLVVGSSVMDPLHHMLRPNGHTRWRSGASFRAAWLQNGIAIHAATQDVKCIA